MNRTAVPILTWLLMFTAAAHADPPWKYDIEVISSSRYQVANHQTWCDEDDRIWTRLSADFGENTDAFQERQAILNLVSEDRGVTWRIFDGPWPGPRDDRSIMPDGMIVETGTHYWVRHPRTEIRSLSEQGWYVWDLGPDLGYCAVLGTMWVRRSIDGGASWEAFPVHEQFGFFARLAVNSPPRQRLLDDGTIVNFVHGYRPQGRTDKSDIGGLNHPFIVRSADAGVTWELIRMADGALSPSTRGFNEIYPVVWPDGRIFAMMRTAAGTRAYSVTSPDGGRTWSKVHPTPILAKHPNPTRLADGAIVVSYQRRNAPPFGVRARFTRDLGGTWSDEVILRDDVPMADGLVQPQTVEMSDGTLFTAQKRNASGGVQSFIGATCWRPDRKPIPGLEQTIGRLRERGQWRPDIPLPPRTSRYNASRADESPWVQGD